MHLIRRLPVKAKLAIAILGTTGVSLLVACGLFAIHEVITFRQSMIGRVTALAGSRLSSTAALDFDERQRAAEILDGVAAETSIIAAGLYTGKGELFAKYSRTGSKADVPVLMGGDGAHFEGNRLYLFRPIIRDSERIGTIGLVASSHELKVRLGWYAMISALVLTGSLGLASILAYVLQRTISKPIQSLASTAALVSARKDYSIRTVKVTEDELGQLADSFNQMLAGIEARDATLVGTNEALEVQIAARVQAERELKALNEGLEQRVKDRTLDLQRSNKELEQFAYVASHDLQEPLRMIVSYLQLLERRYMDKFNDEGRQFLKFAVDGGQRMQTLILDLLAFSRVGTRTKPFATVDLNGLMRVVLANLKVAIVESGATITQDALPTVSGDPTQLAQLFQNLVSNGMTFRAKEPPRIHVTAWRGEREWCIGVQDNGIGIEPQYFERIFVIFQRLHTRDEYPGTGIGLAVCKKIVERHGGRIWVESEPGKGSKFSVTIADFVPDGI